MNMFQTQFLACIFLLNFSNKVLSFPHSMIKAITTSDSAANATDNKHNISYGTNGQFYDVNFNLKNESCNFKVKNVSKIEFTYNILKNRYNFVYLKLNFVNFSVNASRNVISKTDWIWTYRGEKGAHQYLYIPEDFGYLSFGLLWAHTMKERLTVDIEKSGDCKNLIIGNEDTDNQIGHALGDMTSEIASKQEMYNSSLWCYYKRTWTHSSFLYNLCMNSICTIQTIEYECCKFHFDYVKKIRTIQCHQESYHYGTLWWILPIIAGNICFGFYPLLLTKLGMKIKKLSKTLKKERSISLSMNSATETFESNSGHINTDRLKRSDYLSLKSNPISVFSTLVSPFYGLILQGTKGSRALRIWIIILPMCLAATRVLLDYIYAYDFIVSAVQKGALLGFSTLLAGAHEARKYFIYAFGGPIVATSICFLFGCLLIVFPSNLENFVAAGMVGHVKQFLFLMRMPLKLKEHLSGLNIRRHKGCRKIHHLFLAQIFMLINFQFWTQSIKLFRIRWGNKIFLKVYNCWQSMYVAVLHCAIILPFYMVFCLAELLLAVLYYLFPVVNCFFILLKSFCIHYNNCFQHRGLIMKCLQRLLFMPMIFLFFISWYTYCITFFDGFWFLSKIAMLTYSGIFAYPHLSYGYLVLAFMTLFYVTESINAFSESYKDLLKMSLEFCEKFQNKHIDNAEIDQIAIKGIRTKYGIKIDLFYLIINTNLPRRNQLFITILKLSLVISVLVVSVKLLVAFDKFKDLSIVTHVFTVLFVCALPKIIKTMCLQKYRLRAREEMKQRVFKTITYYVRNIERREQDSEDEYHYNLRTSGQDSSMACVADTRDSDTE
ncbi:uncharacterized protein LOC132747424 [Ruditapes philippinarum]|uniref:uncharacterized protein LOC132747424 n=1 Tax=Ruditapes philippinarum TaxID=129788 RepID=UPI00295B5848|nr:uncharacterized protein LOC132747424 [Ruditapes philippinarum]